MLRAGLLFVTRTARRSGRHRSPAYYGWCIAITLAVTETISWGIVYYAFSVFLTPMETDLNWTRAELTAGFSMMWLVAGLAAFPVGAWIDRHGARALMTAGSVGASLLVIAWAFVGTLPAFYLVWAALGVCAAAVLYEPAFAVLAIWFQRKRGRALAIVTFAAGLASTIFLPLSDALLVAFGWRTAVLLLGVFMACITIPAHALVLRRRPADFGWLPDGAAADPVMPAAPPAGVPFLEAVRGRTFWLVTLTFALAALSAAAIRVHFIPFLIAADIASGTAAFATGAIGIMQVVGRVAFAPLDQRFSSLTIVIGVCLLQAIALALLLIGSGALWIGGFIVLFGAAQGALTLTRPSILAELYGTAHFGRIASIMALCLTVTTTTAPLAASLVFDQTGSYQPVLWCVVVLAMLAAVAGVAARRQPQQRTSARLLFAQPVTE